LVRVWGGSSLSHLLSANAPPLTALFVWRVAAEKNGTPLGGPGAAPSQGWPHFTHWTKKSLKVLSLTYSLMTKSSHRRMAAEKTPISRRSLLGGLIVFREAGLLPDFCR
jgi:hypothetical protein